MSREYKAPECGFTIEGDRIRTDNTVHHKVTGTSMGGILGISPWSTPFQVACALLGLGREEIGGKPAVVTGRVLEPVVVGYAAENFSQYGMFVPAEQIFEKREGDHDSWVSDFEDDVFAGHVDGAVIKDDGSTYVLEIKTSANLESWLEGVPEYYFWQVALYNEFITKQDRAYVVLGIVDDATYRNPMTWTPNERTVALYELDIDRDNVSETLDRIRKWYEEFVMEGITPPYDSDNKGDVELYNHLCLLAKDITEMEELAETLGSVDERIAMIEAEHAELYIEQKAFRAQLKEYMSSHNLVSLNGSSKGITAKLTTSYRETLDKEKMMLDGIDPDQYMTKTEVKTLKVAKNKEKKE